MGFWNSNSAAPNIFMTLPFSDRSAKYLRTDMPKLIPNYFLVSDGPAHVHRLLKDQSKILCEFLNKNYGGSDWKIQNTEVWIHKYMDDPETVILGLFKDGSLIASIFSVPIGAADTSNGGHIRNLRVIEGLCVLPAYRSCGVAGFMIHHMDVFTSYKFGVCAHLWSREVSTVAFWDTSLRSDLYGYRYTGAAGAAGAASIEWNSFVALWGTHSPSWVSNNPCIIVRLPSNRRGSLKVYCGYDGIVVVSDTNRRGADKMRIYEIVWSGRFVNGALLPATADFDFKQLLDSVAAVLPHGGVLFGTTSCDCGGLRYGWEDWRVGASGAHAVYLYNYMPPAFNACRIFCIRDEI